MKFLADEGVDKPRRIQRCKKGKIVTHLLLEYNIKLMNAFTVIQPKTIRIRK